MLNLNLEHLEPQGKHRTTSKIFKDFLSWTCIQLFSKGHDDLKQKFKFDPPYCRGWEVLIEPEGNLACLLFPYAHALRTKPGYNLEGKSKPETSPSRFNFCMLK